MNNDIGWELYRTFLAVLTEGSLSGAARALGITQPTAGRHISTLEDAFGVHEHLGHAAETDKGVVPMGRLFAVKKGFFERLFGG